MKNTATIVGAGGFIGQALLRHLSSHGWKCNTPNRNDKLWPKSKEKHGVIFYCAGLTADYAYRPFDTFEAHISLLTEVLQSANYDSLVYLSSTRLYDGMSSTHLANENCSFFVQPDNPRHLYDITKLAGEVACHALGKGRAKIARLSCVYQDHKDTEGFLPFILGQLLINTDNKKRLIIDSSPHYKRDYVHLWDVVNALVDIATKGNQLVYNIASGENISNADIARTIYHATGHKLEFKQQTKTNSSPIIDISRLRDELAWQPTLFSEWFSLWAKLQLVSQPKK